MAQLVQLFAVPEQVAQDTLQAKQLPPKKYVPLIQLSTH
jgi:hypothetical protein